MSFPIMSKLNPLRHSLIIVLACAVYTFSFSKIRLERSVEYMEFLKLVRGWADTPFQYRFLVPWLAGIFSPYLKQVHLTKNLAEVKSLFEYFFTFALLCSFAYASPYLIQGSREDKKETPIRWTAVCLLMLALPFHYIIPARNYYYPSDIPAILFFILGLTLLRLKKWVLYLIVLTIGTFNRETIIFLAFVFLLTNWKDMPRSKLVGLFIFQIMTWAAVKVLLWWVFQSNTVDSLWYADGFGIFKNSLELNLQILRNPESYVSLFSVYGYLWIPAIVLWKNIRDEWLKSALLIVPFFHLSMLIPSEINELRIYAEMLPLVILGVIAGTITGRSSNLPLEEIS